MKTIKNTTNLFFLFILISSSIFSQTRNAQNAPYVGTWEYQKDNQIFRLNIWEDSEPNPYDGQYYLNGNYKMIEKNNGAETIIYSSNPNGEQNAEALNGLLLDGVYSGIFHQMHDNSSDKIGTFEITSFPTSEISFHVSKMSGININPIGTPEQEDFEIPNDIILIKKE